MADEFGGARRPERPAALLIGGDQQRSSPQSSEIGGRFGIPERFNQRTGDHAPPPLSLTFRERPPARFNQLKRALGSNAIQRSKLLILHRVVLFEEGFHLVQDAGVE